MRKTELYHDEYEVITKPETQNSLQNQIVAISKSLARNQINWTLEQRKLFYMCLTKVAWSKDSNNPEITLDKKEIIEVLGLQLDSKHRSQYLRSAFKKLKANSGVHWTDPNDSEIWEDGALIRRVRSTRGEIVVLFDDYYMPLLQNLAQSYVTFLTDDVYGFKSTFSYVLFHDLRLNCDTRKTNWRDYTTKQLKELFGLSKDDYMRKDGTFDRSNFEKYVLDTAIEEINKTKMIHIQPFMGMVATKDKPYKLYEKIKKHGLVVGYRLKYDVRVKTTPPNSDISQM